jgi:2,4-dienoyl-CoA reductase-like NADH-dependent reductase (Old Yellow Enzyme family)
MTLPNRVIMTSVKLGYGTVKGEVTERHIAFYVRLDGQEAYPLKLW